MKKAPFERTMEWVLFLSALLSIVSVVFIILFIFRQGLPLFKVVHPWTFLTSPRWEPVAEPPSYGILSFVVGSLWVTLGALILAVPIGLAGGIFMAEMAKGPLGVILREAIALLAGIPSVIYGLFGYMALSPWVREVFGSPTGLGILTASIVLAIMILPTIIAITEVSLRGVAAELKEGSLALGASHWMTIHKVMIPKARSGILAGIILGMGRAIGETMAVLMVAGNSTPLPKGLLSHARTLTMNIATDMKYAADDHKVSLFTTGIVLFLFILLINMAVQALMRRALAEEGGQ